MISVILVTEGLLYYRSILNKLNLCFFGNLYESMLIFNYNESENNYLIDAIESVIELSSRDIQLL